MDLGLFEQTKQELINLIIEFENTERKISILNNLYYLRFFKELEQQRYLQYENDYLIKAIAMKSDGKAENEIKEFLEQGKKEFSSKMQAFYRQYQTAQQMEQFSNKKYTKGDFEKTDEKFEWYCANHHPFIKAQCTDFEKVLYSSLIFSYRLGNIAGVNKLLEENQESLSPTEVLESEKESLIQIYQKTIFDIKEMLSKTKEVFPLNKENIFYDDSLLTREEIYLREKNYQAREMNKAIHQDFQQHFSFEFTL